MNKKLSTIININEIHSICKEYFEDNKIEFSEEKFEEFLKFLEIDFYDWVKENIRQFYNRKKE
ncbi:hypothetical protein GW846_06100 [Candidatus Gracilibacteria bacterium]|uniref:Uncharacterized protein n=1 Tax=Candidatus Roizmanbacteria bacterium CG_4_10_14_0_2_um_filter_36_35 TaxID=1974822 RepID=A0A2M7U9U6_9BACT|nr:hypothetical protein [Candidatus Gracilibacteria bacterium]PIZ67990.1 MAG: hypothetical protein COY13_02020 [Candidatus Roizmanbacteria bacterium CG_4_10_14_0_2_um_filter_36_35]